MERSVTDTLIAAMEDAGRAKSAIVVMEISDEEDALIVLSSHSSYIWKLGVVEVLRKHIENSIRKDS
jgi:hypothetical protein